MQAKEHYDAVIIGSGFGGSVMAHRLTEAGLTVCLLERGKRYPPGSFARSPKEMRANFWDPSKGWHGLFQIWSFDGIDGVVSAGVGGGSLIYANVMIRKDENWFVRRNADGTETPWPITRADLEPHYNRVEAILAPQQYPLGHKPYSATNKTLAFRDAAEANGLDWELPYLAVTFGPDGGIPVPGEPIVDANGNTTDNLHGRTRYTCRLCGECDVGCNYGSKNTLDYNFLTLAVKHGLHLNDHCEVRTIAPRPGGAYMVGYVRYDPEREGIPVDPADLPLTTITADQLILSAGTFGSTYLMLKNADNFPNLNTRRLGNFFSGNGDFLGFVLGATDTYAGQRQPRPLSASHGPVITSTIRVPDTRDGGDGPGYYIQDAGYPGLVDWLVEATDAFAELKRIARFLERRVLAKLTRNPHHDLDSQLEQLIGSGNRSDTVMPLLGMGLDTADGTMRLDKAGQLALEWTSHASSRCLDRINRTMDQLAKTLGAEFADDPIWYLQRRVITVHPLGGCSMGATADDGVVDSKGQVFNYPGFTIADGSVMPGPVGPNPSLTIAALSDRFADEVINRAQMIQSRRP